MRQNKVGIGSLCWYTVPAEIKNEHKRSVMYPETFFTLPTFLVAGT